jgi:hypothetical protein
VWKMCEQGSGTTASARPYHSRQMAQVPGRRRTSASLSTRLGRLLITSSGVDALPIASILTHDESMRPDRVVCKGSRRRVHQCSYPLIIPSQEATRHHRPSLSEGFGSWGLRLLVQLGEPVELLSQAPLQRLHDAGHGVQPLLLQLPCKPPIRPFETPSPAPQQQRLMWSHVPGSAAPHCHHHHHPRR